MDAVLVRLLLVVAVVAVVALLGRWWQGRVSRVRTDLQGVLTPDELAAVGLAGSGAAARALLLGSPTCAPCVAVKRVLAEVAAACEDFVWVDVDAAEHLEFASRHHVLRVPTLFVVDRGGRVLARTSGVPAARELLAVADASGVPVGIPE